MDKQCDCDVGDLLREERQYCRWSDTHGMVWCMKHRVWVGFDAPKEAFDSRIAVSAEAGREG